MVGTQVNNESSVKSVRMREDQIHGRAQHSGYVQVLQADPLRVHSGPITHSLCGPGNLFNLTVSHCPHLKNSIKQGLLEVLNQVKFHRN